MFKHKRKHGMFLGVLAIFVLAALIVMLLWNAIMPGLVGAGNINYLQAAGLMILCRILFGGLGHGFHGRARPPRFHGHAKPTHLHAMDPEQRETIVRHIFERLSGHPAREPHSRAHAQKNRRHEHDQHGESNDASSRDGE